MSGMGGGAEASRLRVEAVDGEDGVAEGLGEGVGGSFDFGGVGEGVGGGGGDGGVGGGG